MNTKHFTRKIRSLFGKGVFAGYTMIFVGLAVFIFSALFEPYQSRFYIGGTIGLFILLGGLLLSFSYYGVAIRLHEKQVRNYKAYLGLKSGTWKPLPDYDRVVVEQVTPKKPSSFKGITPAIRWYKIRFLVILANDHQAQVVSVKPDKEAAMADANYLAEALGLEVLDYVRVEA